MQARQRSEENEKDDEEKDGAANCPDARAPQRLRPLARERLRVWYVHMCSIIMLLCRFFVANRGFMFLCIALGVGLFHSGIEIAGDEYSFASGAGVFTNTPKQAAGMALVQ